MDLRWRRLSVFVWLGVVCILTPESNFASGCRLALLNGTDVPPGIEVLVDETVAVSTVVLEVQGINGTVTFVGDKYLGLLHDSLSETYQLQFIIPIGDDYDKGNVSVITGTLSITCDEETDDAPDGSTVLVFINDENTHDPTASSQYITMDLAENLPVGLDLRQFYSPDDDPFYVQDEDRDGKPSSEITFFMEDEFLEVIRVVTTSVARTDGNEITRYTPVIGLRKSLDLAESTFTATLNATDNGIPARFTLIDITVNVLKTNDGPPKFDEYYYTSEVLSTATSGQLVTPGIQASIENDPSIILNFQIVDKPQSGPQFRLETNGNNVDLYLDNDVDPSWPDKVVHVVIEAARPDNPASTDTVAVTIVFTDPVTTTTSTTPPTTEMTTLCPTMPPTTCPACPTVTEVTCETFPSTQFVTCPSCPTCPTVTEVTCEPVTTAQPVTCPSPEPCTCPTAPPTVPVTCPTSPVTTENTCPECICTTEHIVTNPTTNPSTNTNTDTTRTTRPVDPSDPTCPPCPSSTPGLSTTLASTSTSTQWHSTVTPNDLTTFCQSIVTCDCTTPVTLPTTQSTGSTGTTQTTLSTESGTTTQSSQSTASNGSTQSGQSTTPNGSTQSSQSTASNTPTQSSSTQHFTGSSSSTSYGTTLCPPPEPCTTVSPFSTCAPCDCTTTVSVSSSSQGTTLTPPTSTSTACPTPTPCDCTTTSSGTTSRSTTTTSTTITPSTTTEAPTPPPATVYFERSHYAAEFLESGTGDGIEVVTVKAIPSNSADQVTYTLTGGDSTLFNINQDGLITMKSNLAARSFNFKARATIPNNAYDDTDITVHIIASIDPTGPPRFNQSVYVGALKENETSENVAQVSVWDGTGVSFEIYRVSPDSLQDNFDNNGPVITCVKPVRREDATSVEVTIWATRDDQVSEATVYIPIEDINDKPSFPRTNYVIGYPKRTYIDQTVSMPVYRFQAVDKDEGENAVLAYELTGSAGDSNYFVEASTGTLYASYSDSEDRCQTSACKYTLTVRDLNGAGLAATASVVIRMLEEGEIQTVSVFSTQIVNVTQIASDLTEILGYNVETLHATLPASTKRLKASGEELVLYLYAVDSEGNFVSRDKFANDMDAHSSELEDLDWQLESTNEAALPSYAAEDVISGLEESKADLTVATGVLGAFLGLAVLGALGFAFFVYYWKDGHFRSSSKPRRDSLEKHQKILASSRLPDDEPNGSLEHGGLENHAYTENERPNFAESAQADKITSILDEVIVTVQPPTPEVKTVKPYLPPVEDEIYSPESPKPKKSIIKTDTTPDDKKDGGATNGSKSIKFNPNPDVIQLSSTGGAILNTENLANNPDIEMEAL